MLKKLDENMSLRFRNLDPKYKKEKNVLGRFYGEVATFGGQTRNGRLYSEKLWEKLFESDLIKERFANGGIFGELCHPDREEVDFEKVAIVMPEPPVKDKDGSLIGYVDILDTPCGRIAYQLAKYGYKFGISSRGTGDLVDGPNGEEVDPDTYSLTAFDLVEMPGVYGARMSFAESLDTKKYNKTLKQRLSEELENSEGRDKEIMEESLKELNIILNENTNEDFSPYGYSKAIKAISDGIENDTDLDGLQKYLQNIVGFCKSIADDYDLAIEGISEELVEKQCQESIGDEIKYITKEEADKVISERNPKGLYIINEPENNKTVAIDNSTGDAWTEEFDSEEEAIRWLNGEFEMADRVNEKFYLSQEPEKVEKAKEALQANVDCKELVSELLRVADNDTIAKLCRQFGVESKEFGFNILTKDEVKQKYGTEDISELVDESLENGKTDSREADVLDKIFTYLRDEYTDEEFVKLAKQKFGMTDEELANFCGLNESISESCGDIEVVKENEEADCVRDELLVNELQQTLLKNKELEKDNLELQEKLSVCSAKEISLEEELKKYKTSTASLSETAKKVKDLKEENSRLTEELRQNEKLLISDKRRFERLGEQRNSYSKKLEKSIDEVNSLKDQVVSLKENLEKSSKRTEDYELSIKKYQKALKESKDLYIRAKADSYNLSVDEVKSNLSESFKLKEVDSICEDLYNQKKNLNKLPFRITEDVKINAKSSKNEYLGRDTFYDDDNIDSLLKMANLFEK